MDFWAIAVSFGTSLFTAMGIGGGSLLLIYFTLFLQIEPRTAIGMGLVQFVPVALAALVIHHRSGFLRYRAGVPAIAGGLVGAGAGAVLAGLLPEGMLRTAFAAYIIGAGILGLFQKKEPCD